MELSGTHMLTLVLFLSFPKYIDLQTLTLCQTPEKNTNCILECKTKDFNEPVTFAHPSTKDVGSCATDGKCSSHYGYYDLSQSTLDGFITRFHITKLDRPRDEGDWACTYGNIASNTMNLTVHSRPLTVDVEVKPTSLKVLEIRCICSCLYPVTSVEIRMAISNQDNLKIKRKLRNLKKTNASTSRCAKEEQTLFGSLEIDEDNWPGKSIDIECFCEDSVIEHIVTKKITHILGITGHTTTLKMTNKGVPEEPRNFELVRSFSDQLEIKWNKGIDGGHTQRFFIQYITSDRSHVVYKEDDGMTTEFNMKLTGLIPSTSYELWIYAENEKGKSRKVGLNCTTLEEIDIDIIPTYMKVVIPFICCGCGSICFTILLYYCVLYIFKRISTKDAHIYIGLKCFRREMYIYRKSRLIKYIALLILVTVASYVVTFIEKSDYVIRIIVISLFLGIILAIISNAFVWSIFIIDYFRQRRNKNTLDVHLESQEEQEFGKTELGIKVMNLIANSKRIIKDRVNEGTFVKTKGYLEGWKKSLHCGVVMLTGEHGDGRTTYAYHIMNKWVKDYNYTPIMLNKLRKFNKMITANETFVILIKEVFDNVFRNRMEEEELITYSQMMMNLVTNGRTKVIMTNHVKTMHNNRVCFQNIELFDERFCIDLSDKRYRLTKNEKEEILRKHCEANNIQILENSEEENPTNIEHAEEICETVSQSISCSRILEGPEKEKVRKSTDDERQNPSRDMTKEKQSMLIGKSESEKEIIREENIEKQVSGRAEGKATFKKPKKRRFNKGPFKRKKEKATSTQQDISGEIQTLMKEIPETEIEMGVVVGAKNSGEAESEKETIVEEDLDEIKICEEYTEKPVSGGAEGKEKIKKPQKGLKRLFNFNISFSKKKKDKTIATKQDTCGETQTLIMKKSKIETGVHVGDVGTGPLKISEQQVNSIIKTEPSIGYPESCALFCKNKRYTVKGLEFFSHPLEVIIEEFDNLRHSLDNDESLKYEFIDKMFKKKEKTEFDKDRYQKVLGPLTGLYIAQDEDGDYIFMHNSIYVAVGLSMAKRDPDTVLKKCNWDFLRYHTKLEGEEYNKDVTYLIITPDQHETIKTKFFYDLRENYSVNRWCGYISKLGTTFMKSSLDEVQNNEQHNNILKESCARERGVFVHACRQENRELMVELWSRYKQYIAKQIVDDCRRLAKNESIELLLNQWIDED